MVYSEISIKDQIAAIRNCIRDMEMKHFMGKVQAEVNRGIAAQHRTSDKHKFTAAREQSMRDESDAASIEQGLPVLRARLDALLAEDPDNALVDPVPDESADEPMANLREFSRA